MAEDATLKLQQVVCPSCNRPINTFNPNKLMSECPYCHSKLVNPLVKPKDVPVPDRIIQFTTDESSFEHALVDALVEQDYVPTNIFQAIDTGDVIQAYLPMYLFEGTYNASWSCESSYSEESTSSSGKSSEVKKWRPQNGNASGNFAFLCLANEGTEIPDELRQFTRLFPYDVMLSKVFNPEMIDYNDENLMTLERNADATLIWQKYGKEMVEDTAKRAALDQIGNQEIRNFRASSSHNLTNTGRFVMAPFWFVYYNYGGSQYYFMMDGTGQRSEFSHPVNQEEIDAVAKIEKKPKMIKWLWLLAIPLYFLIKGFVFIYLIVWFIAKIVIKRNVNKQINQMLEDSKVQRRAAANRL